MRNHKTPEEGTMPTTEYARYKQRMRKLPPTAELAARVRDGVTLKQLAKELGTEPRGLVNHLIAGGFMVTGESEPAYRRRVMKERLATALLTYKVPWMQAAICAQTDPDAFYPEHGASTAEAKLVCAGCPVRSECLEYALENNERHGVWAGLSERERRNLMKERAA
jgi:WhiB family redox-sensing transcriptional regulator